MNPSLPSPYCKFCCRAAWQQGQAILLLREGMKIENGPTHDRISLQMSAKSHKCKYHRKLPPLFIMKNEDFLNVDWIPDHISLLPFLAGTQPFCLRSSATFPPSTASALKSSARTTSSTRVQERAATNAVSIQQLAEEYWRIDQFFLISFPMLFFIFNIIYWLAFIL